MDRSSAPLRSSRLAPASQLLSHGCRLTAPSPPGEFATIASIYVMGPPLSTGTSWSGRGQLIHSAPCSRDHTLGNSLPGPKTPHGGDDRLAGGCPGLRRRG